MAKPITATLIRGSGTGSFEGLRRPDRINVFVAKKFSDGGFGHANAILPLQTTGAAPSFGPYRFSHFGVLMAHEIGLVGLEHTASRACYGGIKVFEGCGRKIEYPCFEFDGFGIFKSRRRW